MFAKNEVLTVIDLCQQRAKHNDSSIGVWIYAPTSSYYANDQIMGITNKDWLIKTSCPI